MPEHLVAVVALDDVIPLDFAIPVEVFSSAGYRVRVCAPRRRVRTTVGFGITPDADLRGLADADSVVLPGFRPHDAAIDPAVVTALSRAHQRGARMMSICVGAFGLAQAGVLDGRRATTHWHHTAELARAFPAVAVQPDVLYVDDGDVLSSAGVSSGMDLCLHVVRRDLGADVALRVSQELVTAPHRDGNQAQFIDRPIQAPAAGPIGDLCAAIVADPGHEFTLAEMAERCAMSTRTLSRRFREATGSSPLKWVLDRRMDEARRLLETTDLSVDQVAEHSGFVTALNLRAHFRRRIDTTPTAYRHRFADGVGDCR